MRLSVVNHEEVQAVLHAIKPLIARVVEENWEKGYQEISTSLPEADIMGMILAFECCTASAKIDNYTTGGSVNKF